ncbi:homocysteine S-methyltransferase [Companilactobacillus keshanensis]|uniref:Homocysteine S-methyltransferase n=1 Tax=Companilactobacillus keshanensis TaxID=2486003 RepID=A0ABW4BVF9_9LACO|nr:homocysteine S-methyltransferase [Companilactobacillus keshanensis]
MINYISDQLKNNSLLVLDGAMATELEKHGIDTDNELWSAMALIKNPEAIKEVHESYFKSGAKVATTNTYQANVGKFQQFGLSETESKKLIIKAVQLAQSAKGEFKNSDLLVAGSIGPYGAYLADGSEYRGDYDLSITEFMNFHRQRMQLLNEAQVDLFAFETQPNFEETKALSKLLNTEFPRKTAWMSFSIKDSQTLCDGTPLNEAVKYFNDNQQIAAIGVNCTKLENIEDSIVNIRKVTKKPIVVYPNNGDIYDPKTKTWQPNPQTRSFKELVPKWIDAGARLIGGCCRTTPCDINEIAEYS